MDKQLFKELFDVYFEPIKNYVFYRVGDIDIATDITQDVFLRLWEKQLSINRENAKYLLYKIARDMVVSRYRREKVKSSYVERIQLSMKAEVDDHPMYEKQLKEKYELALMRLPEKQRVVFLMNRFEELKYKEIADRLSISVKAVEKRMSNALDFLRKVLTP